MNRTGMQIMLISALVLVAFFALAPLMCQLAKAQTQYSVNIWAWDYQGGWQVPVRIYRDGVDTGFNTPATFIDQTGTHTFTVPNANSAGHPFSDWDSGGSNWTDPTLTVSSAGTYTARYRAGYSITIWGWDYINGWSIPVPISIDGTSSGFSTPHTFTDLNGPHYFTVPNTNSAGHLFSDWSNDWTDQDLTVSSAGVYTARYREGYSVTITAWCVSGLGWMSRPITLDGSYTGFTTPHTFYLVGTHTIEVPSNDEHGDPFVGWDEGASSSPTITVYSAGVFTAKYRHPPIGSIVINNGAAYTTSTSVTLSLTYQAFPTGSVVSQARYSNDGVWDTEVWETPAASKAWVLASASGDGVKAVYFQVKDSWGMLSPTYEDTIILDTTPPTGSFVIDEGAVYTNTTWVSMHVTSTDTTSGIAQCRWSEDGVWDGEEKERWLGFDVTPPADWYITWNFTLGDGVKTLYLQLKDHAGLVSPTYTDSIILDTYAPKGYIMISNSPAPLANDPYTSSTSVTVFWTMTSVGASNLSQVRYSNDGVWDTEQWENWIPSSPPSKAWTLTPGDGTKTVYCQLKSNSGMVSSATISDTIILDTTPPIGSMVINGGATTTSSAFVTLTLSATDPESGVAQMRFIDDGSSSWSTWEAYATTKAWTLPSGDGTKNVYAQFKNGAGLVSIAAGYAITLQSSADTTPPTGTITINGGAASTSSTSVTLTVSATDAESGVTQMRFSNDAATWSNWEAYATSKSWTLTSGDGLKTVYAQFNNGAGLYSISYSDTITLQTASSGWTIQTVDTNAGEFSSIALDPSGHACISYYDYANGDLKYARWDGSAWNVQIVDSVGDVGEYTSLAVDSNGNPCISYYDHVSHNLKFARWTGTTWNIQIVDATGNLSSSNSLALDPGGNPCISYYDGTNGDLKYARWTGSSWSIQVVDSAGLVGFDSSLVLDSGGIPCISYFDYTHGALKYARWTGTAWNIQTVDSGIFVYYTSLALDPNGNPCISYFDGTSYDLKFTRWTGSAWKTETVDSAGTVGTYTSLAVDSNGNPCISYCDNLNFDLKFARWIGTAWNIQIVDTTGDQILGYNSLTLDVNGHPCISYFDGTYPSLKFAYGLYAPTPDTTPPTGSILINGDAATTNSVSVVLTLSAADLESGVTQMHFSNDGSSWSAWEAYATSKAWTLSAGDGAKTVYVQFKNGAGLTSPSYSDSITLQSSSSDTTPPVGSIAINGGAATTNSASVTLTLSATDNSGTVTQMRFANMGESWTAWEPYTTIKPWTLTPGTGTKTVLVQFKDGSGVESAPYGDTIAVEQYYEERTFNVTIGTNIYTVATRGNSSTSDFSFNQVLKRIRFTTNGTSGTACFCNITIPAALMSGNFSLFMDDTQLAPNTDYTQTYNGTHYTLSLNHAIGLHTAEIFATNVIPEFPPTAALSLLVIFASAMTSGLRRKIERKKPCSH